MKKQQVFAVKQINLLISQACSDKQIQYKHQNV